jgi:AraC-like DNA-binding protein
LADEACTYQQLLNASRRDIAIDYLRDTQLSVEQIAELVDYSDAANFRKAFKKWTGRRPIDYRSR